MLRIVAKINIGNTDGTITHVTCDRPNINRSSTLTETIGHHAQIQKPFILGRSRLGSGQCYTKKANFYIGDIVADSNGNFPNNYNVTIQGTNLTQVTIIFNKQKNEFPRSITIDGNDFYDDDVQWTIPLESKALHYITISNWNTPNSPLVISSVYADLSIDIDEKNLLDFERTIMERNDTKMPSFGIISNSGRLSFIDTDGEVADLIAQRLLTSENVLSAYLEDTETGYREQIASFKTQEWSYDNSQSIVDVALKDDLEEWQVISVAKKAWLDQRTMLDIYNYLKSITPTKYVFQSLDSATSARLSSIFLYRSTIESTNLWAQWTEFCEIAGVYMYKNSIGNIVISLGIK